MRVSTVQVPRPEEWTGLIDAHVCICLSIRAAEMTGGIVLLTIGQIVRVPSDASTGQCSNHQIQSNMMITVAYMYEGTSVHLHAALWKHPLWLLLPMIQYPTLGDFHRWAFPILNAKYNTSTASSYSTVREKDQVGLLHCHYSNSNMDLAPSRCQVRDVILHQIYSFLANHLQPVWRTAFLPGWTATGQGSELAEYHISLVKFQFPILARSAGSDNASFLTRMLAMLQLDWQYRRDICGPIFADFL